MYTLSVNTLGVGESWEYTQKLIAGDDVCAPTQVTQSEKEYQSLTAQVWTRFYPLHTLVPVLLTVTQPWLNTPTSHSTLMKGKEDGPELFFSLLHHDHMQNLTKLNNWTKCKGHTYIYNFHPYTCIKLHNYTKGKKLVLFEIGTKMNVYVNIELQSFILSEAQA